MRGTPLHNDERAPRSSFNGKIFNSRARKEPANTLEECLKKNYANLSRFARTTDDHVKMFTFSPTAVAKMRPGPTRRSQPRGKQQQLPPFAPKPAQTAIIATHTKWGRQVPKGSASATKKRRKTAMVWQQTKSSIHWSQRTWNGPFRPKTGRKSKLERAKRSPFTAPFERLIKMEFCSPEHSRSRSRTKPKVVLDDFDADSARLLA